MNTIELTGFVACWGFDDKRQPIMMKETKNASVRELFTEEEGKVVVVGRWNAVNGTIAYTRINLYNSVFYSLEYGVSEVDQKPD